MKKLLLTTALLAATAISAQAQDQFRTAADAMQIPASDLIGKRVYASEAAVDATEYDGAQKDWQDIGEINDVMLNRDGSIDSVLVDIGGFLGIGERQVAVGMNSLKFVADSATPQDLSDYFLVLNASRSVIEGAPAYERSTMTETAPAGDMPATTAEPMADATAPAADATAPMEPAADATAPMAPAADTAPATTMMDGYVAADMTGLTADQVIGTEIYGPDEKQIGEVSDIKLAGDNKISDVIVDVGGFLGIGQKSVALAASDLTVMKKTDSDDLRIQVNMTEQQLKDLPEVK
ncbi:MAG: PRC-barrel domain-containing protein [Cypionkella sp.]